MTMYWRINEGTASSMTVQEDISLISPRLTQQQVFRNLLNCRGGDWKENEAHTCRACERERAIGSRSPQKANAFHNRGGEEEQSDGEEKREWKGYACLGVGSPWGRERDAVAESRASRTCNHKHVEFAPLVSAVYIPVHSEYR